MKLILHMRGVDYASSTGLGIFMQTHSIVQEKGGMLILAAVSPQVRAAFELMGLEEVFHFAGSVEEAELKLV